MRRRRDQLDPLADVPKHLRVFGPGWLEVAAQGADGYDEARAAGDRWLAERRAWQQEHSYRGSVLEWLRADNCGASRTVARLRGLAAGRRVLDDAATVRG